MAKAVELKAERLIDRAAVDELSAVAILGVRAGIRGYIAGQSSDVIRRRIIRKTRDGNSGQRRQRQSFFRPNRKNYPK